MAHISYTMSTHGHSLPDMYTLSPRASGVHIRQTNHVHGITIAYIYCILRGQIKGFNRSITTILFEVGSYRTVVG